ncbi:MAG: GH3 auxin-responsive promoter, partial [Verrucomicrobiaceae bacterium]
MNASAAALLEVLGRWQDPDADPWVRLRDILDRHGGSAFGRAHGFEGIRSPEDFREAIRPMNYDDHRSWIERCAAGERNVLACDEPSAFERTSGTSSQPKWIPLT